MRQNPYSNDLKFGRLSFYGEGVYYLATWRIASKLANMSLFFSQRRDTLCLYMISFLNSDRLWNTNKNIATEFFSSGKTKRNKWYS